MDYTVLDRDTYLQQLQAIHGYRNSLGLDPNAYRELLHRLTGSRSAKFMTPEQRQRVINFMRVHQALDEALLGLEEARDTLNQSYAAPPRPTMAKAVYVDGKLETTADASIEEIIASVRGLHGPEVRLVAASERRDGRQTLLELRFQQPEVRLLAS